MINYKFLLHFIAAIGLIVSCSEDENDDSPSRNPITSPEGYSLVWSDEFNSDKIEPGGYTSAKLTTQEMISVRFGRIDVRAMMPEGQGMWPAIWLLGDNIDQIDWPGCGEIDVVEVLGHEPATTYATFHYTNGENQNGEKQIVETL